MTRSRRVVRSQEEDMAKDQSDIFICRLKKDDYWAYLSPFVAHGGGTEIQFRNLTDDAIEIDLGVGRTGMWDQAKGPELGGRR